MGDSTISGSLIEQNLEVDLSIRGIYPSGVVNEVGINPPSEPLDRMRGDAVIQAWKNLGWDQKTLVEFDSGVHVTDAAQGVAG